MVNFMGKEATNSKCRGYEWVDFKQGQNQHN